MKIFLKYILFLLYITAIISCERNYVSLKSTQKLIFSTDTVQFDTVFTDIKTITHSFKVYNPYEEAIMIDEVRLEGGENSQYKINVDGSSDYEFRNVTINPKDSIFIFIEGKLKKGLINKPFEIKDSIIFRSGIKTQKVILRAFGQDVVTLTREKIKTTTFTADKPYLINDYLVVDSTETLTIEPGSKLYFNNKARLVVFGNIKVNGTIKEPVSFSGIRMEKFYADKPGQWDRIHLMPSSGDNVFNNAIIKNSIIGLYVDSCSNKQNQKTIIKNTTINNVSKFGLLAEDSRIDVINSIFGNCGFHSVALTLGGIYNFYHCTIANYYNIKFRSTGALFLNNYFMENNKAIVGEVFEANFYNTIITGANSNELDYDFNDNEKDKNKNNYSYHFTNCLIRVNKDKINDKDNCKDCILNKKPEFLDTKKSNFNIDFEKSPCKGAANEKIAEKYPKDKIGNDRYGDNITPDIGCYQAVKQVKEDKNNNK